MERLNLGKSFFHVERDNLPYTRAMASYTSYPLVTSAVTISRQASFTEEDRGFIEVYPLPRILTILVKHKLNIISSNIPILLNLRFSSYPTLEHNAYVFLLYFFS